MSVDELMQFEAVTPAQREGVQRWQRRARLRRWLAALVAAALLAGLGTLFYVANRDSGRSALPRFASAEVPDYGTIVFDAYVSQNKAATLMTVTTNREASVIDIVTRSDATGLQPVEVITDGRTQYVNEAPESNGEWVRADLDVPAWEKVRAGYTLHTFETWIPEFVRRFTTVLNKGPDTVAGRDVTRYELALDVNGARGADPAAYAVWELPLDASVEGARYRVVLWVDDAGVVWKRESWGEETTDRYSLEVTAISPEAFVPAVEI
jgi:hypothetical protein